MENEDNKGMWKSSVRICIGVGVILGGILAFGIGSIFWESYTIKRNPVYQTEISDFELLPLVDTLKDLSAHENKFLEQNGIKTLNCFIF